MEESHDDRGLVIELRHQSILNTEELLGNANGVDKKTFFKCERTFELSRSCQPGSTVLGLSLDDLRLKVSIKLINIILCDHDHRHDRSNYVSFCDYAATGRR